MRRQESVQVEGKLAGRKETEMRSEKQQVYRQRCSHPKSHLRFAPPAVVALGGSGAAHRMHQNERPPLPGTRRCTTCKHWRFLIRVHSGVPAHFRGRMALNA